MTYAEALRRYGSDKPDLRVTLEIVDVEDAMKDVAFKVFSGPANDPKCRVAALRVPGGAAMPPGRVVDAYFRLDDPGPSLARFKSRAARKLAAVMPMRDA